MSGAVLEVCSLSKHFSGVNAVDDVSFTVAPGTIHGLVGPNGAGKSTVLGLLSGFIAADAGSVSYRGKEVVGLPAARVVALGMARTFQEPSPITGLTVLENVLAGLHIQGSAGTMRALVRSPRLRREERDLRTRAMALLDAVGLGARARANAGDLSFGQLRYLEVVRALGTGATMLLLDEPAAGMGQAEMQLLISLLTTTRDQGRGILLVDHDMRFVLGLCDVITVMDAGAVIAHGTPDEIAANALVRTAYLGALEQAGDGGAGGPTESG